MFSPLKPAKLPLCMVLCSAFLLPAFAKAQVAPFPGGERAEIVLNVPLDAIVWVEGVRMSSVGLTRSFVSPPLIPGREYAYDLRISYVEGGRAKEIKRHVVIKAGERHVLNFAQPNRAQTRRDLYLDPAAPAPWGTSYYYDPLNSPNYPNFLFPGWVWRPW